MEQELLEQIKEICLPLLSGRGVELVEFFLVRERGRVCLKFLVDKPQGITLDECSHLNGELGRVLERHNLIQESYILEVSSPGLDRPLKITRDFERSLGKLARITLHKPIHRQNVWIGFVEQVNDEELLIRTEEGAKLRIPRDNIAKARQEIRP